MSISSPTDGTWRQGVRALLRAEPTEISGWLGSIRRRQVILCVGLVVAGGGAYGAVIGAWRDPLQALFAGVKLPLAILLTTLGNALLNAMLAPLLGLNFGLRQTLMAILMTFAVATALLGSLSPVAAFIVSNLPPFSPASRADSIEYAVLQLTLFGFIAISGIVGNVVLVPTLQRMSGRRSIAARVLLIWLAMNLLLGSQISWILRPFIWDPGRPVEFLGPEYLQGSFYETVFKAAQKLVVQTFSPTPNSPAPTP